MTEITAPVGIVGAGPIGLTMALALARAGVPSAVFDAGHQHCVGSRAIALHRSALATWRPLGITEAILAEGVAWRVRRTFHRERELHTLEIPPPGEDGLPVWINLPQSRLEELLIEAVEASGVVALCWGHRVTGYRQTDFGAELTVEAAEGWTARVPCDYVVAADGANSTMRRLTLQPFPGQSCSDRFLITDIRAEPDWPAEPHFHFDHPTHPGSTLLIHPQPRGVWRVDWRLHKALDPAVVPTWTRSKLDQLLGTVPYEIVWSSVYQFQQRLLPQLSHGRVFFAGDAAHLCAPFGARGLNSGIADVACLAPRLARVISGDMSPAVLRSYGINRMPALIRDQHDVITTMRFMAPQTWADRARQRAILAMAQRWEFARPWVNSGRMYRS